VIESTAASPADYHTALVMRGMPHTWHNLGTKGCVTFDLAFALDVFTRFIDSVLTPSRIDDND